MAGESRTGAKAPGLSPALSRAIGAVRLPLMIGPVLVHACLRPETSLLQYVLARMAGDVAVPAFFFISGLLYFATFDGSRREYLRKTGARMRSLLPPYLFWNLVAYLVFAYAVHMLAKPDFVRSFWAVRVARRGVATAPADGPLYFVKWLLCLSIAAPALWFGLRRRVLSWLAPAALAFWIAGPLPGLRDRMFVIAPAFFSMGGYAILRCGRTLERLAGGDATPCRASWMTFLGCAALAIALHSAGIDPGPLRRLAIVAAIPALLAATSLESPIWRLSLKSGGFPMFLFCTFDIVMAYMRERWRAMRTPDDIHCLLCAAIALAVPAVAYLAMARLAPRLTAVLTGGRSTRKSH